MSLILSMHDYKKRPMPNPGMLDHLARREGGLRPEHTARVLAVRRGEPKRPEAVQTDRPAVWPLFLGLVVFLGAPIFGASHPFAYGLGAACVAGIALLEWRSR